MLNGIECDITAYIYGVMYKTHVYMKDWRLCIGYIDEWLKAMYKRHPWPPILGYYRDRLSYKRAFCKMYKTSGKKQGVSSSHILKPCENQHL